MAFIDVLIGIDGTHENLVKDMAPADYDRLFATSHIRAIVSRSRFGHQNSHYVRGPAGLGTLVNERFLEALRHIERHGGGDPAATVRLHLAGFSRGAAIALDLANALSLPQVSRLEHIARLMTFGKSVSVVQAIDRVRNALAGRLSVASLALFDPVDMSSDIDTTAVGKFIGTTAVVRRSASWGSRLGWTNVGDTMEKGSAFKRSRVILDGTHGGMGGMPGKGDIPKVLARVILGQLRNTADWDKVEARYRKKPLEYLLVKAAFGAPGTFVNPFNGGLISAAAHAALQLVPIDREQIARAAVVHTYRRILQSYAVEGGLTKGSVSLALDLSLGSFPGMGAYFLDFKACSNMIEAFRALDEKASSEARNWMVKAMGNDYPALVGSGPVRP